MTIREKKPNKPNTPDPQQRQQLLGYAPLVSFLATATASSSLAKPTPTSTPGAELKPQMGSRLVAVWCPCQVGTRPSSHSVQVDFFRPTVHEPSTIGFRLP